MKRILQKIAARVINSDFVLNNPFVNYQAMEAKMNQLKINRCYENVTIGEGSVFYEQAEVRNIRRDRTKIRIGNNTHIRGELLTFGHAGEVVIGNDSFVGRNSSIWSAAKVEIGNGVLIAHNCNIIDTNSHELDCFERVESFKKMVKHGFPRENFDIVSKPIFIEDFVWISFNVTILKGVRIGRGAIIAADTVITHDVEPFCVIGGNPAKVLKKLDIK